MPTTFGVVMLALLVIGTLVGIVLWVRDTQRRRVEAPRRPVNGDAPFDENGAGADQARRADRQGWF